MIPKSLPSTTTFTPVPDPLLGELLKSIDSLDELKCILRALWHIHRRKGPSPVRHPGGTESRPGASQRPVP